MQFEDPSDARLSDEEARRKIMQRTLTGAALCAHQFLLGASVCAFALHETTVWLRTGLSSPPTVQCMLRHVSLLARAPQTAQWLICSPIDGHAQPT